MGKVHLPGGAATCSEGFVVNFLKVPLACWGSSVAAVQHNSLAGELSENILKNLLVQVAAHLVYSFTTAPIKLVQSYKVSRGKYINCDTCEQFAILLKDELPVSCSIGLAGRRG